jgi:hypothetical protein
MLQQIQIVKVLDNQVDIEDPRYVKDVFMSFHHLDWLLISVNVTIYRTISLYRYQSSSNYIMMITTAKLGSYI